MLPTESSALRRNSSSAKPRCSSKRCCRNSIAPRAATTQPRVGIEPRTHSGEPPGTRLVPACLSRRPREEERTGSVSACLPQGLCEREAGLGVQDWIRLLRDTEVEGSREKLRCGIDVTCLERDLAEAGQRRSPLAVILGLVERSSPIRFRFAAAFQGA